MRRRLAISLAVPGLLLLAACGDDGDDDGDDVATTEDTAAGEGTIAVRLEETTGVFIEGFEIGLRFDDAETGDEIARRLWTEFVQSLPPTDDIDAFYDSVYEQVVPAGVVRVGADVNIGPGGPPEVPDLDVESLPCELDVDVDDGETVTVEVTFDDAAEDCMTVVEG